VGLIIHHDAGHARGVMLVAQDMSGVDAVFAKVVNRAFAKHIPSDFGDDGGLSAEPGGHHRLVGAFAAEAEPKRLAGQRLARFGQSRSPESQINVSRANDTNPRLGFGHETPQEQFQKPNSKNQIRTTKSQQSFQGAGSWNLVLGSSILLL
jgi:hypothetical protein